VTPALFFYGYLTLNWLLEIFTDRSDQARLVAILISAVVAVLIVLLNQWFLSRRAKRELLIEKVEELFSVSNQYTKACKGLINSLTDQDLSNLGKNFDLPMELVLEVNGAINRMQMICGLYFRRYPFSPEEYYIWNMPILEIAVKEKVVSDDKAFIAHEESMNHLEISRHKLDSLCESLMRKYGH